MRDRSCDFWRRRKVRGIPIGRILLSVGMFSMGVLHCGFPRPFERAVPEYLPDPKLLVILSGVCEVAGGLGLLNARTRRGAAIGLIALFVAVFPANVDMAIHSDEWVQPSLRWLLWARLPFQALFIGWAMQAGQLLQSPVLAAEHPRAKYPRAE
jgi:uncharacterized membrane protein